MGKPVVIQALAEFGLSEERLFPLVDQYCVRAAALLAAMWSLPSSVGDVIIHHGHEDSDCTKPELLVKAQTALMITDSGFQSLPETMLAKLNLYPEDINKLEGREEAVGQWVETLGG